MSKRHKWEWARGGSTGEKQCVNCGMVKFPGRPGSPATFFIGSKQVGEGKTPPCDPASVILNRLPEKAVTQ